MSIVVFDTETSGLPDWKLPSDHQSQPHLVQLAIAQYDRAGVEIAAHDVIVRPDGWEISDHVAAIHGITTAMAIERGIPESEAVDLYINVALHGDVTLRVAHNRTFDARIMRIAMLRSGLGRELIEAIEARPGFCTMQASKNVLKLPPTKRMAASGRNDFKPPKLAECILGFFNEPMPGAHNAMVDCRAAARVYFFLRDRAK